MGFFSAASKIFKSSLCFVVMTLILLVIMAVVVVMTTTATIMRTSQTNLSTMHKQTHEQMNPFDGSTALSKFTHKVSRWANGEKDLDANRLSRLERVPDILTNNQLHNTSRAMPVLRISVLGERNSGTTWMTAHLRDCFSHEPNIYVTPTLSRHKHWFQHDVVPKKRINSTLVVSIFRNPCTWVDAMRRKPYRQPNHYQVDDWHQFVTTPWTIFPRLPHDLEYLSNYRKEFYKTAPSTETPPPPPCQKNFNYNQINQCLERPYVKGEKLEKRAVKRANRRKEKQNEASASQSPSLSSDGQAQVQRNQDENITMNMSGQEPFYELRNDGSGLPYANLLDMRADKILNFLSVAEWDWVKAVLPIQYEDMVRYGTQRLLDNVQRMTGVTPQCQPYEPQPNRSNAFGSTLPLDMVKWLTDFGVDWDTEALLGYETCFA